MFSPLTEQSLHPALREAALRLPLGREALVVTAAEFALPTGVPDLTVFGVDRRRLAARLNAASPPLTREQDARVVAACGHTRPSSLERLAAVSGIAPDRARRAAAALVRQGALEPSAGGWRRTCGIDVVHVAYALEAKVADWRAGIWQCLRYASAADAAGLVLPQVSDRVRAKVIAAAKLHGIGVFVGGRWLVRPRKHPHTLARRLWVSEHLIAALQDASSPRESGA